MAGVPAGRNMTKRISRRWWVKNMLGGAALAGASRLFPAPNLLADPSPNSKLATAVIGCGGRGEASLGTACGEKLVAIVWSSGADARPV